MKYHYKNMNCIFGENTTYDDIKKYLNYPGRKINHVGQMFPTLRQENSYADYAIY
jgi:hypothetical protein